jgi:hypothetical protein
MFTPIKVTLRTSLNYIKFTDKYTLFISVLHPFKNTGDTNTPGSPQKLSREPENKPKKRI